jgi:hypothetical protein
MNLTDPSGLFPWVTCWLCGDIGNAISKATQECKDELAQCKDELEYLRFLDKYGAYQSTAMWNCVKTKTDPKIWAKLMGKCFGCGFLSNPWPRPPRWQE